MKKTIIWIFIVLAISGTYWYWSSSKGTLISSATYACAEGKAVEAKYFDKGVDVEVAPGEMPVPTGSVSIKLSDGRKMTLPQTISASGIRYANEDESIIFWSKGTSAFMMENDVETYSECK